MTKRSEFSVFNEFTIKKLGLELCAVFNKEGEKNNPSETVLVLNEKDLSKRIKDLQTGDYDTSSAEAALTAIQNTKKNSQYQIV